MRRTFLLLLAIALAIFTVPFAWGMNTGPPSDPTKSFYNNATDHDSVASSDSLFVVSIVAPGDMGTVAIADKSRLMAEKKNIISNTIATIQPPSASPPIPGRNETPTTPFTRPLYLSVEVLDNNVRYPLRL